MVLVYIYDHRSGCWESRLLTPAQQLPYAPHLSAETFLGRSRSGILWTDRRLLEAYSALCEIVNIPLPVRYAFRRVGEAVHLGQSGHYAGLALDIRLERGTPCTMHLMRAAQQAGFTRFEPGALTPGWLHMELVLPNTAGLCGSYPLLREGDRGVHVFLLQDMLHMAGLYHGGLNGCFGRSLHHAAARLQRQAGLLPNGRICAGTWHALERELHKTRQSAPH